MEYNDLVNQKELMKRYKLTYPKLSRLIKHEIIKEIRLPFDLKCIYYDVKEVDKALNNLKQFVDK